ncbi:MAG: HD domain-containing protein [Candidatus Nitrospinota bacterium M3_3B_026]
MAKLTHEVRDGIHGFILFDQLEKRLIDSAPMQRLRCIHQLAMCYQVYPGATHKRFEHSLGVMEIAGRIFERLFRNRLPDTVHERIAEELEQKDYWRRVVRLAGLLHDIGHLPFSHGAEEALLPEGWNHERITASIIRNSEIAELLQKEGSPIKPEDVIDVAWDAGKRAKSEPGHELTPWKTLLNEIVCGNTFGADRIDYLLRDSWHAGVAYGRFDPHILIAGLTALIDPNNEEISLGLDIGAIHAAEALLLARYFMYTQVYFHDVRRAYDLHLKEFLQAWIDGGKFPTDWEKMMRLGDHEVVVAMREAAANSSSGLHDLASRALSRKHFRTVYELVTPHKKKKPTILKDLLDYMTTEFGEDNIRSDSYGPKSETNDFLVQTNDGSVESSLRVSGVVANVPAVEIGLIFANPEISEKAKQLVDSKVKELLKQ